MHFQSLYFTDDGVIPNSRLPLLLYKHALGESGDQAAAMEALFARNGWTNSWRNGIYPFHHYHSNTHEVLGIYKGFALLQFGGARGRKLMVQQGDILVIPAGVGHRRLEDEGLGVVGAYPGGVEPDLLRGAPGERPGADQRIATVALPEKDPYLGAAAGLLLIWQAPPVQ
ncbi:cupin [Taibaiella koreensis]|uniref:cupin n=1 Tax=Taibaiella koreensis TaxID=1268548 RepID=UPI000E59CB40|nr:cupin [Taibaiella koreensis]